MAVIEDNHDEDEETLTLTLSNVSGNNAWLKDATATGTIENTDHMPKAWLARFGRTVAEQVIEAVEARMRTAPRAGVEATLAGRAIGGAAPEDGKARGRMAAWPGRSRACRRSLQITQTRHQPAELCNRARRTAIVALGAVAGQLQAIEGWCGRSSGAVLPGNSGR